MSPEKARVFIAEDNKESALLMQLTLRDAGHSVVLKASTLGEAERAVDQFRALGIQVALLDGNISSATVDGADGARLAQLIRSQTPEVKTVGIGSGRVEGVDVNVGKSNYWELGQVVSDL